MLSTPDIHITGHLHWVSPLHEGTRVRIAYKLNPADVLANHCSFLFAVLDMCARPECSWLISQTAARH